MTTVGEILKEHSERFDAYDLQPEPACMDVGQGVEVSDDQPETALRETDLGTPVFVILGGRACSNKAWFRDRVYDPKSCIYLNADDFMCRLPEYQGWNAPALIEEATYLVEKS